MNDRAELYKMDNCYRNIIKKIKINKISYSTYISNVLFKLNGL